MRRDLALRGAVVALLAAGGGIATGFIEREAGASNAIWFYGLIAACVVGLLSGYLAFRRPAAALRTVSEAAGRIGEGELAQRVPETSGPAGDLLHSFNVMAGRIEQLFDSVAAEHARLEAVFDASSDGMVALSADTTVRFLNPAAVQVFEKPMSESVGRSFIETARDYELDALVRRVIADRTHGETSVVTFGPRRMPLRAAALPISNGGDWAVLLTLTDLTEVQRVDQVRRDFLSNVSHELRTPLAAIRALVETLDDGVDEEDAPEFLGRIHQQVERLTSLVNELLDLSRIESGAINLDPEPVEVAALVAEAASLLRTRTEPLEVTVVFEGEPLTVEADRPSLLRVVSNLLDNAAKWSPQGGTIHVGCEDEGELVAIQVRDEGPGIPEQDLPRVFERFYKGEASRATSGVGLGLAIVKHLVRAHGGTATVESRPGEGASFTVRLPRTFVGRR
ncbi:MAG: ATP-binding protein [Dehalococcoidia bacterium]|jgi:two-component system phosphate regulon sensor histidine kinase PhoR